MSNDMVPNSTITDRLEGRRAGHLTADARVQR